MFKEFIAGELRYRLSSRIKMAGITQNRINHFVETYYTVLATGETKKAIKNVN